MNEIVTYIVAINMNKPGQNIIGAKSVGMAVEVSTEGVTRAASDEMVLV